MYFNNNNGAIIISDSRIMLGPDYSKERKIQEIDKNIVFAASGYTGISEKLIPAVKQTRYQNRKYLPSEIVEVFEDEMAKIFSRFKGGFNPRFPSNQTLLTGIIGIIDAAIPKLYCLHENGYAELITRFRAIGDGSRHAHNILQTLYTSSITKDEALEIGIYAIMQVATIDSVVDDYPQIAIIEKYKEKKEEKGIKILNCDVHGNFHFDCIEIDNIKKKINGIEQKRTQVFRLLLRDPQDMANKLDKILQEHEAKQKRVPETEEPAPKESQ